MQPTLVVICAFGDHAIGDIVTAADVVTQILASDHADHVVKVTPHTMES